MCPLGAARGIWLLLWLSVLGLLWQARRYRHGTRAARGLLVAWALWIGLLASSAWTARLSQPRWVLGLSFGALGLLMGTAFVVWRDWRAATQARRTAEAAIDQHVQNELARLFREAPDQEDATPAP